MVRRFCLSNCVLATLVLAVQVQAFTVVEDHEFTVDLSATPWTVTVDVPMYNPLDHGGRPLAEVMFILDGDAMSSIDVQANGGDVTVLNGEVGSFITAAGGIGGLFLNVLPTGQFAPPALVVPNGTTQVLTDVSGTDQDMLVLTGVPDVSGYEGSGTFAVEIVAQGTSNLQTAGGNWDASQRTDSSAKFNVQYKVETVPEPTTCLVMGLGVLCACGLRRFR